jgi:hypothetical protein
MKGLKFAVFAVLLMFCSSLFCACEADEPDDDMTSIMYPYPTDSEALPGLSPSKPVAGLVAYEDVVHKADFSNGNHTITLYGLTDESVYLVKVNMGDSPVDPDDIGTVVSWRGPEDDKGDSKEIPASELFRSSRLTARSKFTEITGKSGKAARSHGPATEINKDIYVALRSGRLKFDENSSGSVKSDSSIQKNEMVANQSMMQSELGMDNIRYFNVKKADGSGEIIAANWVATGNHCKIWVRHKDYAGNSSANSNQDPNDDERITPNAVKMIADKFDEIYRYETAVFGYEYGGGVMPNDPTYGGIDRDPLIHILIYDIYDDAEKGDIMGYFLSADEFEQSALDSAGLSDIKSNMAEMFYLDLYYAKENPPNKTYATLAHEFQHMIHFNRKTMSSPGNPTSSTWFNEMLSTIAEDLISPLIGIDLYNEAHPVNLRIPGFLSSYNFTDPTVWLEDADTHKSYSIAYGLGALLVRNFGGVDFVKEVISNPYTDIAAIDAALQSPVNTNKTVSSFAQVLSRLGEALLFNDTYENRPIGVLSFNNTVERPIAGAGTTGTFFGFDIYEIIRHDADDEGPVIWSMDKKYSLHPRTLILQTDEAWKQYIPGSLSITLSPPTVPGIDTYVIAR